MSKHGETILVVEDDAQIRSFITYTLKQEGFPCLAAGTAQSALVQLVSGQIDLVLLDLGLPDFDGMEVIRKVREWSEVPIIVVSARDQDNEKASALDSGADDYLTKPFSATELMARIRVALRHAHNAVGNKAQTVFTVGGLSIDLECHQVSLDGEKLHVTPMEYNLGAVFQKYREGIDNPVYHQRDLRPRIRQRHPGPAGPDGGAPAKNREVACKAALHLNRNRCRLSAGRRISEY